MPNKGKAPSREAAEIAAVRAEVERISHLDQQQLRLLYFKTFRKAPPEALSRDLIVRQLAWDVQEKAFGGHSPAVLKLLNSYGRRNDDKVVLFKKLQSGTTVIREYQGVRHTVTIAPDGFVWQGRTYDSLSAIAREITGSQWNGPRFFGLRAAGNKSRGSKAS